jgi:hypothetical protein
MAVNKAKAQSEGTMRIAFKILDTTGTPTVVNVLPPTAAGDIAITDTGPGIYDLVIKNFKGPQGATNVQATAYVTSVFASATARSYSGEDLSLTIHTENDASTDTDTSVDVIVEAY